MGDLAAPDRRSLLKRGLLLAGGMVGLGAVGAAPAAAQSQEPEPEPTSELLFFAVRLQSKIEGKRPGQPLAQGDRLLTFGDLLDQRARKVGEFYSSAVVFGSPFGSSPVSVDSVQQHTFSFLKAGTLFGTCACGLAPGLEATGAVVGGTGGFAGTLGTYASQQSPTGLGGTGTGTFSFSLTRGER